MSRGSVSRATSGRRPSRPPIRSGPTLWSPLGIEPLPGTSWFERLTELLSAAGGRGPLPEDDGRSVVSTLPPGSWDWFVGDRFGGLPVDPADDDGGAHERGAGGDDLDHRLDLVAEVIREACRLPLESIVVHTVADRLAALEATSDVEHLLDHVDVRTVPGRLRLGELGRWLCRFGTVEPQVRAGLAILAAVGGPQDRDLVFLLGLSDRFTREAVTALRALFDQPEHEIFDLAKQTRGGGRGAALLGLRGTTNPVVQNWLVNGGYDDGQFDTDSALIAAVDGDLLGALQSEGDARLLDHAGRILSALVLGSPGRGLSDYAQAGLTIDLYLSQAERALPTVTMHSTLCMVQIGLTEKGRRPPIVDAESRSALKTRARALLARPIWTETFREALESADLDAFAYSLPHARMLGLDTRPAVLDRVHEHPRAPFLWEELVRRASANDMADVVRLAEHLLPLGAIEVGPARDGLPRVGPVARVLGFLLSALREHPGVGWSVIRLGLEHSLTSLRLKALSTLGAWRDLELPPDAMPLLRRVWDRERDPRALRWMGPLPEEWPVPRSGD
ncbi:hypothetical protein [Frondihabitans cladoniiphilus]|uniref:HEAT repeat protein n=1 Tax=Frondihabitans cladoniiphilus TaxID=715785 RepID=A0ABP8VN51_9MICO